METPVRIRCLPVLPQSDNFIPFQGKKRGFSVLKQLDLFILWAFDWETNSKLLPPKEELTKGLSHGTIGSLNI